MTSRLLTSVLVLAGLGLGASSASAADLREGYGHSRTSRTIERRSVGYRFPDRPYGLAAIPLPVGPSGVDPGPLVGYVSLTCTPYHYRYYNGCSPRGYGVY